METKDIAKNFIKEVAHYMPDAQIVLMLRKILGQPITYAYVRSLRESMYIMEGRNSRPKVVKEKIGLDLYDHRIDKSGDENIIKQEKKS